MPARFELPGERGRQVGEADAGMSIEKRRQG